MKEQIPRSEHLIDRDLLALLRGLAAGEEPWPLYIYGSAGRGKSCAALWFLDQVPGSLYATPETLVRWVLTRDEEIWRRVPDYALTIVDDIGIRSSDSDLEYVAMKRMSDAREHLPAIWVSNHPPEKIREVYDDRVHSRICCGTWFEVEGDDRRWT